MTMLSSSLSLFVDHDRLLLGTEDGLCVVELNKDSELLCHFIITWIGKMIPSRCQLTQYSQNYFKKFVKTLLHCIIFLPYVWTDA